MIDVYSKYAWVTPLTNKKNKIVFDGFIEIVNDKVVYLTCCVKIIKENNSILDLRRNG